MDSAIAINVKDRARAAAAPNPKPKIGDRISVTDIIAITAIIGFAIGLMGVMAQICSALYTILNTKTKLGTMIEHHWWMPIIVSLGVLLPSSCGVMLCLPLVVKFIVRQAKAILSCPVMSGGDGDGGDTDGGDNDGGDDNNSVNVADGQPTTTPTVSAV